MARLLSAFALLLIVIGVVWFLPPGATLIVSELLLDKMQNLLNVYTEGIRKICLDLLEKLQMPRKRV